MLRTGAFPERERNVYRLLSRLAGTPRAGRFTSRFNGVAMRLTNVAKPESTLIKWIMA